LGVFFFFFLLTTLFFLVFFLFSFLWGGVGGGGRSLQLQQTGHEVEHTQKLRVCGDIPVYILMYLMP
jgi:hypothetical protein